MVEKDPQEKKLNSIENKNNDESDVIEQKNLRFSDKWIWKSDNRKP